MYYFVGWLSSLQKERIASTSINKLDLGRIFRIIKSGSQLHHFDRKLGTTSEEFNVNVYKEGAG